MHAATESAQENDMTPQKKIARRKLALLELAIELQNVSKACKQPRPGTVWRSIGLIEPTWVSEVGPNGARKGNIQLMC